jgi:hypothetical protein
VPDLRYHLISLISVFLALAIGILLGVAMADRGVISDRLEAQVTDIQDLAADQRTAIAERDEEIGRLRERTATDGEIAERMSQAVVSNALDGTSVALVAGPWANDETVQGVESVLIEAGANITSNFSLEEPQEPLETTLGETTNETTTPFENIYAAQTEDVLQAAGDSGATTEVVVFVGGGAVPEDAPPGALRTVTSSVRTMFETWLDAGLEVVGAESSTARRSDVELFQEVGIPSVDNADRPSGRAAIVVVIEDDLDGSYGTKETASDLFPPVPN